MTNFPNQHDEIPVDCVVIERKLRPGSAENLARMTKQVAGSFDTLDVHAYDKPRIEYVTPSEYVAKKKTHSILGQWSTRVLAREFNDHLKELKEQGEQHPFDAFGSTHVQKAVRDEITSHGTVMVGFEITDEEIDHFNSERSGAIDLLLDLAGVFPTDSIRQWRNEETNGLWVPVAKLSARTPDELDSVADSFIDALNQQTTGSFSVDLFNGKASPVITDIPAQQLQD